MGGGDEITTNNFAVNRLLNNMYTYVFLDHLMTQTMIKCIISIAQFFIAANFVMTSVETLQKYH